MLRFDLTLPPPPLPPPHRDIAADLERRDIAVWHQGDGLIADLLDPLEEQQSDPFGPRPTRAFLCAATAGALLQALPCAVITAPDRRRLMLGTTSGPIDLLPMESEPVEEILRRFGLGALSFAWRPVGEQWCDPTRSRKGLSTGRLDLVLDSSADTGADAIASNPFCIAPRRYWIAARLLAKHDLDPTPRLIAAARDALPECLLRIPAGGSARREMQRFLTSRGASKGLRFLHDVGLCRALFPGMNASGAEIVGELEPEANLRWAAWIAGASTQSVLRRLRMPPRPARAIERLLRHHPIDRTTRSTADARIRRIRQKLSPDEIEGLLAWRRIEIERAEPGAETQADRTRLADLELRLEQLATQQDRSIQIQRLALDGDSVMEILGSGPGRRVGLALAHLASFIQDRPASNQPETLEAELREWANGHPE